MKRSHLLAIGISILFWICLLLILFGCSQKEQAPIKKEIAKHDSFKIKLDSLEVQYESLLKKNAISVWELGYRSGFENRSTSTGAHQANKVHYNDSIAMVNLIEKLWKR